MSDADAQQQLDAGMGDSTASQQQQLDDLRLQVSLLGELVAGVSQALDDEREGVAEAVASLEATVTAVVPGEAKPAPGSRKEPAAWVDYASADQWIDLADWVDWVKATYDLRGTYRISPCWPAHIGVAEELAALWSAWKEAAVAARTKDGDALAFWHDRYFAPLLTRLHTIYSIHGCTDDRHETPTRDQATDRTLIDVRSAAVPADDPSPPAVEAVDPAAV